MKIITLFCLFFLLTGCSTNRNEQGYFASFYSVYQGLKAQQKVLNKRASESLPYASLRVSVAGTVPALMPLGYLKTEQQKWFSQNRFGFTTENARITQIYNVDSEISAIRPSPIWKKMRLSSIGLNQSVQIPVYLDFLSLKRFAVPASLQIQAVDYETRVLWGEEVSLLRIEELISIPSMQYQYTNRYWKDTKSGFIWESVQKWGPNVPEIHYQVVKPWQNVIYP